MDKSSQSLKPSRLTLERELVINRARELKAALTAGIGERTIVELDLSNVSEIDVSGLQLLCSAHRTALSKGGNLRISALPSAEIVLAVRNSGFSRRAACRSDVASGCIWNGEVAK
jgi:ABC-type transporter Mla MlaB component